jgi:hypothetical protein
VAERRKPAVGDERPPICPACGVTMGIVVDEDGATRYVCLECGFSDEKTRSWAAGADSVVTMSKCRSRPAGSIFT